MQHEDRSTEDIRETLRAAYEAGKKAVRHFGAEPPRVKQPAPVPPTLPDWHH